MTYTVYWESLFIELIKISVPATSDSPKVAKYTTLDENWIKDMHVTKKVTIKIFYLRMNNFSIELYHKFFIVKT